MLKQEAKVTLASCCCCSFLKETDYRMDYGELVKLTTLRKSVYLLVSFACSSLAL